MKHMILEFAELPANQEIDFSEIEYNSNLNLNVFKGTSIPAVNFADQATETFTKTAGEGADSDRDLNHNFKNLAVTSTQTHAHNETSDNDRGFQNLVFLSATQTLTETTEPTDSDK
jgi:hypothetical protein